MNRHPFASLAFLSGVPTAPIGAGQSSVGPGSALWPIEPRRRSGALWPIEPNHPSAAWWPIEPHATAALWPIEPSSAAALWPIEPNRRAVPPLAAGAGAVLVQTQTLLNQALRKSRVKIVRESDALDNPPKSKSPPASLWRWAPDSRIKTVSCELIQRFQVADQSLWLLNPTLRGGALGLRAKRVFALGGLLSNMDWQDQTDKVIRAAVEREDRLPEILTQATDFWPFYESVTGIHLERAPRLAELMAVVQDTAVHLVMLLKDVLAAKRPVELSSRVMPVIATPGHGSFPSGHATLAALTSELLHILMYRGRGNEQRSMHLDRLARRIAFNRVVAGVHFPVDSQAGYALGTLLARLLAAMAGDKQVPQLPKPVDIAGGSFDLPELPDGGQLGRPRAAKELGYTVAPSPALSALWQRTVNELNDLRV